MELGRCLLLATIAACARPADQKFPRTVDISLTITAARLTVEIDEQHQRMDGVVEYELANVARPMKLWLHASEDVVVNRTQTQSNQFGSVSRSPDGSGFVVDIEPVLPAGTATISLHFASKIREDSEGVFRRSGPSGVFVQTKFEPEFARTAFPSFDSPMLKYPWKVTVVAPRGDSVASNAPLRAMAADEEGKNKWEFEPTPPLPSYLVAFVVGPFETVGFVSEAESSLPITIWNAGETTRATFTRNTAQIAVAAMEDWTNIPFPFPKLDLVLVNDVEPWGAVENPGLILLQDSIFRAGEDFPAAGQADLENVVTHEIVHHWFGNLVGPADWRDVWLYEGAAYWLTAEFLGESGLGSLGYLRELGLAENPPLRIFPDAAAIRPADLAFHDSSQWGAGAVFAALDDWWTMATGDVGALQSAIRGWLLSNQRRSASTESLLAWLQVAQPTLPTRGAMRTLLRAPVPIQVAWHLDCRRTGAEIKFTRSDLGIGARALQQTVSLPLLVAGGQRRVVFLDGKRTSISLSECPDWIYPNAGGHGYYRLHLTPDQVSGLAHPDVWKILSKDEQLSLANDVLWGMSHGLKKADVTPLLSYAGAPGQSDEVRSALLQIGASR